MKNSFEQAFKSGDVTLILRNVESDPAMWIVDIYRKGLIGRKKKGSYWFSSKEDAEEFVSNYSGKK